ncbi:MAG TPA: metallophosphoesterase [Polyangiaceae bacterium]|nr:metallophosphoesterase [Polyangiaceae bacterium]
MKPRHAFVVATLLAMSCLRPTEERVELDLEVGQAEHASFEVSVREGLAAVRALDDDALVLWGSAPSFEVDLNAPGARQLELELQNCLADAELLVVSGDAQVEPLADTGLPTRKRWRLTLPAGATRLSIAPPDVTSREGFRFALLSDVQEAIDDVDDVFERMNQVPNVRFALGAGDLTQRGTREQLERFQSELERLKIPYFATLGNHELGTSPDLFHEYFGRGNFKFYFHGVAFTLIDDASATIDPTVYDWLDDWLEQSRQEVHIVAMHIPPVDPIGVRNGSMASRSEADKLLAKLAEGRVDLTLYGHIHSYYSFDNAGIPAFISGGGGAIPERFDKIGRHFMVFEADARHGITSRNVIKVD